MCIPCIGSFFLFIVDPKDSSIEYEWFDVGMLDYDADNQLFLVQKVDIDGRVVDQNGEPIVNGGLIDGGKCNYKR